MSIHRVWQVEYACGWNIYTLKFIGIWPEERRLDRLSSYKVLIGIAFIIIFCTIPQYWLLYIERHDFNLIMENLSLDIINGTVGFIKMMFFWSSGGQIKDLLTAMEEDWKEVSTKEDEEKMMKYATFSRKIATRATIICYSIIAFYTAQRILSMRTLGRLTYFPSYYPIETMDSPLFELKFIGQMIAATYYSVTYSSVDTFLVTLILHVCGQLKRLQNQLVHLDIGTSQEFQNKLSYIIRRHDYLNKFIETIEDQFNIMLLFQILSCILQLCLECFQELTSTEVARAAYECNWYNLLPHEARSLILIIRRSRSPLRLTAGKFCTLNHELYSSVLKTSMGYLSVLRATMTSDE
ncbi:PREDICTED: odorant receptor 13a-like isoform X2 [Polistes dominula]|uniref:Odorant receptor n=1 Tax=Polistes dominula TaxID=743375 RepID=A0ABM1ISF4_POLDO|nr:PREDICTED: odorant receptor 13a-like isoform X2 [Polistes dominula]